MTARETFLSLHGDTKDGTGLVTWWASVAETKGFSAVASYVLAEMAEECPTSEQMIGAVHVLNKLKEFCKPREEQFSPGTYPQKQLTTM